jgi:hypothetical protein
MYTRTSKPSLISTRSLGSSPVNVDDINGFVVLLAFGATVTGRFTMNITKTLVFQKQVDASQHLPKGGNARRFRACRFGLELLLLELFRDKPM